MGNIEKNVMRLVVGPNMAVLKRRAPDRVDCEYFGCNCYIKCNEIASDF